MTIYEAICCMIDEDDLNKKVDNMVYKEYNIIKSDKNRSTSKVKLQRGIVHDTNRHEEERNIINGINR